MTGYDPVRYGQIVGATVARLRDVRELTRAEVARGARIKPDTLAGYETGRPGLTVVTLAGICRAMGAAPGAVVSDVDELADRLIVDLRLVAMSSSPALRGLQAWAAHRARAAGAIVALSRTSVTALAQSHQVNPALLVTELTLCEPEPLCVP